VNFIGKKQESEFKSFSNPTALQRKWLRAGLKRPGGNLPLFDRNGKRIPIQTIQSCINQRWAEPWFDSPLAPDWHVCRITHLGREIAIDND